MNLDENMNFEEKKAETKRPKQITSAEEFLKLPQEVRDKALAQLKYNFDNSEKIIPQTIKNSLPRTVRERNPHFLW